MLVFHPMHPSQPQGRTTPLAKSRISSGRGNLLPSGHDLQDGLDRSCVDLPVDGRETVGVLTVAAPRLPKVLHGRFTNSGAAQNIFSVSLLG